MKLFIVFIEWGDWTLTAIHQKCSRQQGKISCQLYKGPYEEHNELISLGPGQRTMVYFWHREQLSREFNLLAVLLTSPLILVMEVCTQR